MNIKKIIAREGLLLLPCVTIIYIPVYLLIQIYRFVNWTAETLWGKGLNTQLRLVFQNPIKRKKIIGLAIIIIIAVFAFSHYETIKEENSKKLISLSEIELVDLRLSNSSYAKVLTGRIRNRSKAYILSSIALLITIRDCMEDKCEIIGESNETIYIDVPPQQARDFNEYVSLPNVEILKGKLAWDYRVLSIEGRK